MTALADTPALVNDRYCRPYPIQFRAWSVADKLMLDWSCLMQNL